MMASELEGFLERQLFEASEEQRGKMSAEMSGAKGENLASDTAASSAAAAASASSSTPRTGADSVVPLAHTSDSAEQAQLHEDPALAEQESEEEAEDDDSEGEDTILQKLKHMLNMDQGLRAKEGRPRNKKKKRPSKLRWQLANMRRGRLQGREPLLDSFDLNGIASYIQSGKVKNIICMCGAGISVNAGIPDFRSPGTGLYDNLAKYDLPRPESVFELSYFRQNPKPFYMLSKELFPGTFKPTATHSFIRLLHSKGLLKRCYTQNIDSLEREAGTPAELIVPAHGNFDAAHCIECRREVPIATVKAAVLSGEPCHCPKCGGLVKPDIVFFGEGLPPRFFKLAETDFGECDLLLVIGTSLVVQPFASLVGHVEDDRPRLLINKEKVTGGGGLMGMLSGMGAGSSLDFSSSNYRDALYLGDCDEGVWELCRLLGWKDELQTLVNTASVIDWESEVGRRQESNKVSL